MGSTEFFLVTFFLIGLWVERSTESACEHVNFLTFNNTYFFVHDPCSHSSESPCLRHCDLLVHATICPGRSSSETSFCDNIVREKKCASFQCSSYPIKPLEKILRSCRSNENGTLDACQARDVSSSCDQRLVSSSGECGLNLNASGDAWKKFIRLYVNNVGPAILNLNNLTLTITPDDEDDEDNHSRAAVFRRLYKENTTTIFDYNTYNSDWKVPRSFSECADHMLEHHRFVLLFYPNRDLFHQFIGDHEDSSTFLLCTQTETVWNQVRQILMLVGISLSLLGLSFTIFTIIIRKEHRFVYGFNLLCLTVCLIIAYLSILAGVLPYIMLGINCRNAGLVHVFTILSSVFWMNVIAFDMWRKLSKMRSMDCYYVSEHHRRIACYSMYAWGMPLLIVALGITLDLSPGVPDKLRPSFFRTCWFTDASSIGTFVLYYSPIGGVIATNIGFFVRTAILIYKLQRTLQLRDTEDKIRYYFCPYVKLFLVMGLTWILEASTDRIPSNVYQIISDFIISLQGFIIFLIFGWKKKAPSHHSSTLSLKSARETIRPSTPCQITHF